jgi:NAD(P)H-hydrate epimerase
MTARLRALSRQEIRQLDLRAASELGILTSLLMENAGRGAAAWLAELTGAVPPFVGGRPLSPDPTKHVPDRPRGPRLPRVLVLCGPGNNGGDGAVLARHLDSWRFPVRVIWLAASKKLSGDAALQWLILGKSGIDQRAWFDENSEDTALERAGFDRILAEAEWVVDGLFGTGLSRVVEGLNRDVIEMINGSGKPILALDVPSGLDADTGAPLGTAVRAFATATFAAAKLGFEQVGAAAYTGEVAVIDIGLPRCLLEPYYL